MHKSFLQQIEETFDITAIQSQNLQIWPIFRMQYFFEIQNTLEKMPKQKTSLKTKFKVLANDFFTSFLQLFQKADFVFLSSSNMKKLYPDKQFYNKNLKEVIENIGTSYCFIEQVSMQNYVNDATKKNKLSNLFITILSMLYAWGCKEPEISNENILMKINQEYKIDFDYKKKLKMFFARQKVFEKLLIFKKCKVLVLTCYYSFQAEILAAKTLKIPVIEMQHGVIGKEHPGYALYKPMENQSFPDALMTFGKHDKNIQENAKFKLFKGVFQVGNNYIDIIKNQTLDQNYLSKTKSYQTVIAISCQETIDETLSSMIKEIAEKNPSHLFIMGIRMRPKSFYDKFDFPKNVWLENEKNIYELLLYADLHVTGYSTCAMEALCFGKPNLLLNINGFAKKYFAEHLIDNKTTFVVDTVMEFCELLRTINWNANQDLCLEKGRNYFAPFDPLAFGDVLNFAKTLAKS